MMIYETDTDKVAVYDSSAWVYKTGTTAPTAPALVYITSATISAASSINVNNCFTSTYTNYRIIYNFVGSTDIELEMRLRVGGTDYSGTDYTDYGYYMTSGGAGNLQHVNTTRFVIGYPSTSEPVWGSMDVFSPQVATKTQFNNMSGIRLSLYENGRLNTTTQYDGFSMIANTGNITGGIKVYGYSNS